VQGAIAPEDDQVPVTGEEGGQEGGQVGGEDQHAEGLAVYNSTCTFCHQADGQGVEGSFPPLAGSDFVTQEDPTGVIQTVLHGRGQMPSFGDRLSDEEIAAVVSYIRSAWGNQAAAISAEQVREQRQGQE
jgi:mono/diheme cytochrome c family protein